MAERAEFVRKIECELDKPVDEQNKAKLAFWQAELDKFLPSSSVEPPMAPKKEAVFVLGICRCEDGLETHEFDLVGTAFAVSSSRLLTAFHTLFEEDVGRTSGELATALDGVSCYIGRSATRLPLSQNSDLAFSFAMDEKIQVTLVAGCYLEDWLVLKCHEVLPLYFSICPTELLPNVDLSNVATRVVHCPVGKFIVDQTMKILRPQVLHTSIIEMCENTLETPHGLVTGSSGGVYIDQLGYAIAIHLESIDKLKSRSTSADSAPPAGAAPAVAVGTTTRSVTFESALSAQRLEISRVQMAVVRNKKYIKLLAKKHISFGRGLIISSTDELVAALNGDN